MRPTRLSDALPWLRACVDVALTLRRVPWTTRSALTVMGGVFVSLLGIELPQRLAWDDQLLLEAATGRRALTDLRPDGPGTAAGTVPAPVLGKCGDALTVGPKTSCVTGVVAEA
jgi:hypothetical protein